MFGIKHPARHYIYYLLSKRILDAKGVLQDLVDLGLPVPQVDFDFEPLVLEITRVKATMRFPAPFNPRATAPNVETLAWLKQWKVYDIWMGSSYVAAATDILAEPNVRHLLELLLLGPLSPQAIAERIVERFQLPPHVMNSAVVRAYAHYFWDLNALDPAQWRRFLHAHYAGVVTDYLAALQAPRSAAGAAFVIAVADKDPQLLDAAERYEAASTLAFRMMMHHALAERPTTGATYAAFTALNMMRMADLELDKHRGGSSLLIDELRRLRPVYDREPPLKITEAAFIQRPVLEAQVKEVTDGND